MIREESEFKDFGKPSDEEIPLFYYQKNAVEKWENNNYKLMFEMATGTGKTRTAIGCISKLKKKLDKLVVIICTPQDTLTKQWKNEIDNLGVLFDAEIIADGSNHKSTSNYAYTDERWAVSLRYHLYNSDYCK